MPHSLTPASPQTDHTALSLGRSLVAWFGRHCRDLPWRVDPSPYRVWISEVMLQQTQADRVISYFRNWMRHFPDPAAVAAAPQDRILKAWEGLGYYSRAKNIQAAARIICSKYQGQIPSDMTALRSLPGIGPYTAAAIASLAFNLPQPVVDANVERVMARLLDIDQPIKSAAAQKTLRARLQDMIPAHESRSFSQAVMELGALVCIPRRPQCDQCPLAHACRSLAAGTLQQRPVLKKKKASTSIQVAAGVLFQAGRIFIQKRPPQGLMANLWEFPGGKLQDGESPEQALIREFKEELEFDIRVRDKIKVIKHSYTTFRVTLHIFWCTLAQAGQQPVLQAATDCRWVAPEDLSAFPFPAADRQLIEHLMRHS